VKRRSSDWGQENQRYHGVAGVRRVSKIKSIENGTFLRIMTSGRDDRHRVDVRHAKNQFPRTGKFRYEGYIHKLTKESFGMRWIKLFSSFERVSGVENLWTFASSSSFLASLKHQCIFFGHGKKTRNWHQFSMSARDCVWDLWIRIRATQFSSRPLSR
jgi:hypothetical protein